MNILDKIVIHKKQEVVEAKAKRPLAELKQSAQYNADCRSLIQAFTDRPAGVIAEYKRKSPSVQDINLIADVGDVAQWYRRAGVTAMSVLTDSHFFGGSVGDLQRAKATINVPILRKDFMVDPYQIHESKAIGADIILLIAEVLEASEVAELAALARSLGLAVLMEVHSEAQLEKYTTDVDIVGVNNRNLETFDVDFNNSIRMYPNLPSAALKIAESGIKDLAVAKKLKRAGFDGVLIGEYFMKAEQPLALCTQFVSELNPSQL